MTPKFLLRIKGRCDTFQTIGDIMSEFGKTIDELCRHPKFYVLYKTSR